MGGGGKLLGGGIGAAVLGLIIYLLGGDPSVIMNQGGGENPAQSQNQPIEDTEDRKFVKVVLGYTEDVWTKIFADQGQTYDPPVMHTFENSVNSGCGGASAASGPFYCPLDRKVYIDLSFYQELSQKLGAPGDFAMAYVIAHEVGHHIQNLMGTADKVRSAQQQAGEAGANQLSVKIELQADFYAGVWAHHAQKMMDILEDGDIEEAMNAAEAIGDDRLQKQGQGYVVPESFTHGTSAQRMYWFKKGFETGDIRQGNTFAADEL